MAFSMCQYSGETGKDEGAKTMAAAPSFQGMSVCEYVWVGAGGECRSKSKTVTKKPEGPNDCAIWMMNGAATGQAYPEESDVYLVPRAVFADPMRGGDNTMCLCEAVTATMEPAKGNYRAHCAEVFDKYAGSDPWVGMEQEYIMMTADGSAPMMSGPEGACNCGVGSENCPTQMREMMDKHYAMCLAAGIKICGNNAESAPGQGEFQVGPCSGIDAADHMIMARFMLLKISEMMGVGISFAPKPAQDQSGNGCHFNLSTNETRGEGGLTNIEKICRAMSRKYREMLPNMGGDDNSARMSDKFSFAIAHRAATVRIPRNVAMTSRGHLECRAPAGDCDPYMTGATIMKVAGEVVTGSPFK